MASELPGGPSGSAAVVVTASRPHRVDHQPFGLECRTSGGRVFRPATDRARVSRPQRRRMVRLGADVSLDRQQDPDSRLLLYARHLAASVSSSRVPEVWPGLSVEQFLEELRKIQQFVLLYPPLGDKGPNRIATVLSKQTLAQQALAESLGLEQLCSTHRG